MAFCQRPLVQSAAPRYPHYGTSRRVLGPRCKETVREMRLRVQRYLPGDLLHPPERVLRNDEPTVRERFWLKVGCPFRRCEYSLLHHIDHQKTLQTKQAEAPEELRHREIAGVRGPEKAGIAPFQT